MNLNLTLITYFVMATVSTTFIFYAYLKQSIDSGAADGAFWFFLDLCFWKLVSRGRIVTELWNVWHRNLQGLEIGKIL